MSKNKEIRVIFSGENHKVPLLDDDTFASLRDRAVETIGSVFPPSEWEVFGQTGKRLNLEEKVSNIPGLHTQFLFLSLKVGWGG